MYYFVLLCVFLTVVLIIIGIFELLFTDRKKMLIRLESSASNVNKFPSANKEKQSTTPREKLMRASALLGSIVPKSNYMTKTKKKLIAAAVLMRPEEYLGLRILCGVGMFAMVFVMSRLQVIAVIMIPVGFLLPEFYLEFVKKRRMRLLNSQLPEALSIISNGLRAGFSFSQAMSIAVRDMNPPISEEFARVLRENSLGKSLDDALINLAERNEDDDLGMVVTALLIQRQVGGNLSEILDTISNTIRERVRIKGEIKTLTAQGRLSALVISLLPTIVTLILSLLSPEYILTLFRYPLGIGMVIIGVIMQLIGIYAIFKLVDVKV